MRVFRSHCQPIALLAVLALVSAWCLQALPAPATTPPAGSNPQGPGAAAEDEDRTPRVVEQEEDEGWPDFNKRRKGAPLVIAGVAVILAAAVYFLAIKQPGNTAAETVIHVSSVPEGALVFYDIKNTGRFTPTTITNVTPVQHTIKLTKDGYQDYVETFQIRSGQTYTINAVLAKE